MQPTEQSDFAGGVLKQRKGEAILCRENLVYFSKDTADPSTLTLADASSASETSCFLFQILAMLIKLTRVNRKQSKQTKTLGNCRQ